MRQLVTTITILLLVSILPLYAQTLYSPKFKQAQPIWMYNIKSNYINKGSTDIYNQYNSIKPLRDQISIKGNKCYFLNWITSKKVANTGYGVCGVDIEKRTLDFCYASSYDSLSNEYYSVSQITIQDTILEIFGKRGTNIQFLLEPFKHIFLRHHDIKTGVVKVEHTDFNNDKEDSTYGNPTQFFPVKEKGKYIQVAGLSTWFQIQKLDFQFVLFDTLMNQKIIKTFRHDPEQPIDEFSIQFYWNQRLNDSISVCFVKQRSTDFAKYPHRTWLYFFNVADPNNIKIIKKIDTKDRILYDESSDNSIRFITKDNTVTIMDKWIDWQKNEVYNYLYRLDDKGNEIQYVRTIKIKDHDHYYYWPIKFTDTTSYLLGIPSVYSDNPSTADIVKINKQGEGEYLASIFIDDPERKNAYFRINQSALSEDNKVIILNGDYRTDLKSNSEGSAWSCGFMLEDLIKGSKTNATDQIQNNASIKISPNPTSGIVNIESQENIKTIYVMDIQGKVNTYYGKNEYKTLDLSSYAEGIYFLIVITESGKSCRSKIVKTK